MNTRRLIESIEGFFVLTTKKFSNDQNSFYGDVFNKALKVTCDLQSSRNIELPIYALDNLIGGINNRRDSESATSIFITLGSTPYTRRFYRTPGMMFFNLFKNVYGLTKCVLSTKKELYYGAPGILLDQHKEPLLLATVNCDLSSRVVAMNAVNLYVNPKVLCSTGTLEKFIMAKVIPCILTSKVRSLDYLYNRHSKNFISGNSFVPNIIISENIHNFFAKQDSRIIDPNAKLLSEFDQLIKYMEHD